MSANAAWPGGDLLEIVASGLTANQGVEVSVTMPAVHMCPFKNEVDEGSVTLSWLTRNGRTIELHSLRALLDSADEWEVSHEAYTASLRHLLVGDFPEITVVSTWHTAGGDVVVRV